MTQGNDDPFNDLLSISSQSDITESEVKSEKHGQVSVIKAEKPSQIDAAASKYDINETRSKLVLTLSQFLIGLSVGIGLLVFIDLGISKFIAWRLIEKISQPTLSVNSLQTGQPNQPIAPQSEQSSSDKPSDTIQKVIVYKDLLKEASMNKELLTLLLTSQTALVSGALGFYFGGKDNN